MDWVLSKSTVNTIGFKKKGYVELPPRKGKQREMMGALTDSGEYTSCLLKTLYEKEAVVFQNLA